MGNNQITSFNGTGLSMVNSINLAGNQLTSFDGTGLTSLQYLSLGGNQLTSLDVSSLTSLTGLQLVDMMFGGTNPMTPEANNSILNQLDENGLSMGYFTTTGGRTSAGTADYNSLIGKMWTLSGLDLTLPVTFITAQSVGNDINVDVQTSTGYWKYNHNGTDSSVFSDGSQTITVANANGEFTIIPCLSDGTPSGDLIALYLSYNQLTTFDSTGLSGLTSLELQNNLLTTFDGTGLTSLTWLRLDDNQLTTFDGTGLTSLIELYLGGNQLTSFDGTDLTNLTTLILVENLLTSINIPGLTVLQYLYTQGNPSINTPSINNSLLAQLAANELANTWGGGDFSTTGGRTSTGTTDYDYLIANGWTLSGLDLTGGNGGVNIYGKLRIKGATTIG
jgi:hypothetical protein